MVALGASFQAEESSFDPIPPGEYVMHITAAGMEPTSNGRGRYLKAEMEIVDGPQSGRRIIERLNLENQNPQAVEIAQRTLRAIVHAAGLSVCQDSDQLLLRRMLVRVTVEPRNDKPEVMTNRITGYKQIGGAGAGNGGAAQQQTGTTSQQGGGAQDSGGTPSAPWKKRA